MDDLPGRGDQPDLLLFAAGGRVLPLRRHERGPVGRLCGLFGKTGGRGDAYIAGALDDARQDEEIRAESDEALSLTGRDVGTPIIQFNPPAGTAFFGPVISRLPAPEDAAGSGTT